MWDRGQSTWGGPSSCWARSWTSLLAPFNSDTALFPQQPAGGSVGQQDPSEGPDHACQALGLSAARTLFLPGQTQVAGVLLARLAGGAGQPGSANWLMSWLDVQTQG